ncbi:MAG: tetratricopeptide repeat protein, partial [Burkholderiales bacterium]
MTRTISSQCTSPRILVWRRNLLACVLALVLPMAWAEEDAAGMLARGDQAFKRGDLIEAMEWYRSAAEKGHAVAQMKYGYILDRSEDNEAALTWYRKAAEQGHAPGQYAIAQMYATGEGVVRDLAEARRWWKLAAAQDHVDAIVALATEAERGARPAQGSLSEALDYWQRAAQLGDSGAMSRLAQAFRKGELGL